MKGPCEHCGNADKSKWTTQCLYKGSFPSRRAFLRTTFDPPCACDDYDEGQHQIARRQNTMAISAISIAVVLISVLFFCFT